MCLLVGAVGRLWAGGREVRMGIALSSYLRGDERKVIPGCQDFLVNTA